ncbi:MAG: TonB-dependent receptor [Deltaproteobacteria bacterium]|nr:TonB-dependent receptor [Deltaproteobacteria bacterium]
MGSRWFLLLTVSGFLALAGLSQALAQEEKNQIPEGKERAAEIIMDEVVVTATKTEERRSDVPNSVIIKDVVDIQESPAQGLGDLLANELGMDWRTYGDYGGASQEIHIRGMGGDGTQVFINGVNVNSPSLGTSDVSRIPLNNIERIEVVKGSGSLLYGTGAMGGIINIITKRPTRERTDLDLSAGYGSQDTYHLSLEQGMYLSGDIGYYLVANRHETDGFRDNSDLTHNDISLKMVHDGWDMLEISFYGDYIDREYGRPGVQPPQGTQSFLVDGLEVYSSDAASTLDRGSDEDAHLVLEVKGNPSDRLGFKVRGDYTYMENYNLTRYYNSFTGGVPGSKSWTTNEFSTIEGNMEIKPFSGSSLLLGADYRGYDWKNENIDLDESGSEMSGSTKNAKAHVYSRGIYAEGQYRPWKYFKALAGIRYETHSTFGHENVPRFGLVFNPLQDTVLKFSSGKHFKAPTLNDLFWPREDWGWGMGAEGNPNLKPETGWHSDGTLEQSLFDGKVFLTGSYFEWDIKDKIRWVPDANFFYRPQNLDTYEADGWDLGTRIGPLHNMVFAFNYTKIDAKEQRKGGAKRQALYTPNDLFKGTITFWTGFGLSADVTVRYVGERPGHYAVDTSVEPDKVLESYWTTDMKVEQSLREHWKIALQGNNLFDEDYETYVANFYDSAGTSTLSGYPGAGRSFFLSVKYEY